VTDWPLDFAAAFDEVEHIVSLWDPSKGIAEGNLHGSVSVVGNKTFVLMVECRLVSEFARQLEEAWNCKNGVVSLDASVKPSRLSFRDMY